MIRALLLALTIAPALALALAASDARAADNFAVDPIHSFISFKVKHLNVSSAHGRFNSFQGEIVIDSANPTGSRLSISINPDSIDTANVGRDRHLKGPDFFDAKRYATITYQSKSMKKVGDNEWEIEGDLTLHGVTKPLTTKVTSTGPVDNPRGGRIVGLETSFSFKRSDFGMTNMVGMIGDEVKIDANLEAIKR